MMKIAVNVLVDWIEHKVKGNRYDAQRWIRKKMQEETYEAMIIGGENNEMEGQKKIPHSQTRSVPFFSESVVRMVLCRRQRLSIQLSNLHVNMKERPALRL